MKWLLKLFKPHKHDWEEQEYQVYIWLRPRWQCKGCGKFIYNKENLT